jgi:hypothetical protein
MLNDRVRETVSCVSEILVVLNNKAREDERERRRGGGRRAYNSVAALIRLDTGFPMARRAMALIPAHQSSHPQHTHFVPFSPHLYSLHPCLYVVAFKVWLLISISH